MNTKYLLTLALCLIFACGVFAADEATTTTDAAAATGAADAAAKDTTTTDATKDAAASDSTASDAASDSENAGDDTTTEPQEEPVQRIPVESSAFDKSEEQIAQESQQKVLACIILMKYNEPTMEPKIQALAEKTGVDADILRQKILPSQLNLCAATIEGDALLEILTAAREDNLDVDKYSGNLIFFESMYENLKPEDTEVTEEEASTVTFIDNQWDALSRQFALGDEYDTKDFKIFGYKMGEVPEYVKGLYILGSFAIVGGLIAFLVKKLGDEAPSAARQAKMNRKDKKKTK